MEKQKNRIPELDILRGICVLGMIAVHFVFDLYYFGNYPLNPPDWFQMMGRYGHIFFIVLSGICATLGSHTLQRGVVVFGAGLLVSYVTLFADLILGLPEIRIWFGILHLLGISMMLYPLFRSLPVWLTALLSAACILLGAWFAGTSVTVPFLFPLGLCAPGVNVGSDFFPLFPHLGWFLAGICLGKVLYGVRKTRFPGLAWNALPFRVLSIVGRNSLLIYLLHQPLLILLTLIL